MRILSVEYLPARKYLTFTWRCHCPSGKRVRQRTVHLKDVEQETFDNLTEESLLELGGVDVEAELAAVEQQPMPEPEPVVINDLPWGQQED